MSKYDPFYAIFQEDGMIYSWRGSQGQSVPVGIALSIHQDVCAERDALDARCKDYYDKLVEVGAIPKILSSEELLEQAQAQLAAATALLEASKAQSEELSAEIKALKEAKNEPRTNNQAGAQRSAGSSTAKSA